MKHGERGGYARPDDSQSLSLAVEVEVVQVGAMCSHQVMVPVSFGP